jgi:flagellin
MRINHNIAALNTHRQLSTASTNQSKSMEKLASGLRINKAGDDAAGLAISEKMRGQIRGLEQGSRNAQDAISLIQTAEGGLNETHDILQRMRELAVQSANDTNTNDDRTELQKEVSQLRNEIDRIANNTDFNTKTLLKGDFAVKVDQNTTTSTLLADGAFEKIDFSGLSAGTWTLTAQADNSYTLSDGTDTLISNIPTPGSAGAISFGGPNGQTVTINVNDSYAADAFDTLAFDVTGNSGLTFQIGANANQNMTIAIDDTRITAGTQAQMTALAGVDITSQTGANSAVTVINDAIKQVSSSRSTLGSYQNRLEHSINNLNTSAENLTAAESRIRDVDYALAA